MSLEQWVEYGWLRLHKSSGEEIENLLQIVNRDLEDAEGDISTDWRFGIAYNAALKLCTIPMYAEEFRPEKTLQHLSDITDTSCTFIRRNCCYLLGDSDD